MNMLTIDNLEFLAIYKDTINSELEIDIYVSNHDTRLKRILCKLSAMSNITKVKGGEYSKKEILDLLKKLDIDIKAIQSMRSYYVYFNYETYRQGRESQNFFDLPQWERFNKRYY